MKHSHATKQQGFTLIEMIITLSIFVMVVLLVSNVYLIYNTTQRRTVAMQKVLDDVRYLFDAMSQESRLGRVNYAFYLDGAHTIDLYPTVNGNTNHVLAVVNQTGDLIFFRRSGQAAPDDGLGNKVQYCKETTAGECNLVNGTGWQDVTPAGVSVIDLRFIITPTVDPFLTPANLPGSCLSTPCPLGYHCQSSTNLCKYYDDGKNFQPKVRMILTTRSDDTNVSDAARQITMQTIISSRPTSGKIQNNNFETP